MRFSLKSATSFTILSLFLLSGCSSPAEVTNRQQLYSVEDLTCKSQIYEDKEAVLIVNGRVYNYEVMERMNREDIKTIEVKKCTEEYLIEYGPRAAIAVTFIETTQEL